MDDEVKGNGNSVNYKYRMHDPRIGRFFAVDPLVHQYPELTPYQFSSNRPIDYVELEGLEGVPSDETWKLGGNTSASLLDKNGVTFNTNGEHYDGIINGQNTRLFRIESGVNKGNFVGFALDENGEMKNGVTHVVGGDLVSGGGFNITETESSESLDYVRKINASGDINLGEVWFTEDGELTLSGEGGLCYVHKDMESNGQYLEHNYLWATLGWDGESGSLVVTPAYITTEYEKIGVAYYGGAGMLEWVGTGGAGKGLKAVTKGWIKRSVYQGLSKTTQKAFVSAMKKGIVPPKYNSGIVKLSKSEMKMYGAQYTHKLKILAKGGSHYRILGYQMDNGAWYFDRLINTK